MSEKGLVVSVGNWLSKTFDEVVCSNDSDAKHAFKCVGIGFLSGVADAAFVTGAVAIVTGIARSIIKK